MEKLINMLKPYWFIAVFIAAVSSAWATTQIKIQTLEEAVKENVTTQTQVRDLKTQTERIDERTKVQTESQVRLERMLEAILINQRNMQGKQ